MGIGLRWSLLAGTGPKPVRHVVLFAVCPDVPVPRQEDILDGA
jgi:hypothetical protein